MKIVLVRHGHPDYRKDCLTELGHEQAKKAAQRLKDEGISEIYSSPMGRAYETASYTADLLSKQITKLGFMRELHWGSSDGNELCQNGNPWLIANDAIARGYSLMDEGWTKQAPYANNIVYADIENIAVESDRWLETLGYRREGANYRVIGDDTDKTIALFSHGGSSSAFLSHLLNIPFFWFCKGLCPAFTAITMIHLSDEKGALTMPAIGYANDAKHIESCEISYQM